MNITIFKPFIEFKSDESISIDIKIFSLLLCSIPIALITGPAIPDILLSVIAIYFIIKSIKNKFFLNYMNYFVMFFLIFCIYGICRSIFSELPMESLTKSGSVFYFRYIFFSLAVCHLIANNKYLSKCLLTIILFCIMIVSFDGLYQYFNETNIFGFEKFQANRLTGLFNDEPIIGRYLSFITIFALSLIFKIYKLEKKVIILAVILLSLMQIFIFMTGERAPFFYISLYFILLILFLPKFRIFLLSAFMTSILIILTILNFNNNLKERMVTETFEEITDNNFIITTYTPHHDELYRSGIKMFNQNKLFGIGTNLFSNYCNDIEFKTSNRSCSTHIHQIYLQLLVEQGVIGFLFILIFYLYLSSKCLTQLISSFINKKKLIPFEKFIFLLVLITYFWPFIPTMSFYNNWNNVLIMLPLGYFIYSFAYKN